MQDDESVRRYVTRVSGLEFGRLHERELEDFAAAHAGTDTSTCDVCRHVTPAGVHVCGDCTDVAAAPPLTPGTANPFTAVPSAAAGNGHRKARAHRRRALSPEEATAAVTAMWADLANRKAVDS
jgi:hypothetical protein